MAYSAQPGLEMIERGQQIPDPTEDDTITQQVHSLDPSGPLPNMTPQQMNDRREGGTNYSLRPSVPSATGDATPLQVDGGWSMQQLELLDLDLPQRPVLDDIDMTLRRKVSFCMRTESVVYRRAGSETMHCSLRAAHDSE